MKPTTSAAQESASCHADDALTIEWKGKGFGTNDRLDKSPRGHIYKNEGYAGFQQEIAWLLVKARNERGFRKIAGDARVNLDTQTRYDIDAFLKPLLDCYAMADIIEDDEQITQLFITKRPIHKRGVMDRIRMSIKEIRNSET